MKNTNLSFSRLVLVILASFLLTTLAVKAEAGDAKKAAKTAKPAKAETAKPAATEAPAAPSAKLGPSPMADLKKYNAALKKLFQKQAPSWSPEADAKRGEMRKIVSSFLDFEELSHRALARHWDGLSAKQREEFVATLRDLIERSYIRQVHGSPNYDLVFEKETVKENDASVFATLHTVVRGKKQNVEIEYKLLGKDGRWLVYDVITDEQSMLETYRAEFNKTINKESFDALLRRMKKKLEVKE